MKQMTVPAVVAAALLGTVMVAGCRRASQISQNPQQVARTFMDALVRNDHAAIEATLTATARRNIWKHFVNNARSESQFTVGTATIAGDTAVVPVTVTSRRGTKGYQKVDLRSEGGEWRVCGMALTKKDGTDFPVDFEQM